MLNPFLVISNFVFRYTLIVEKVKPMIAANNENIKKLGFSKIKQLRAPNTKDTMPDNLKRFIL